MMVVSPPPLKQQLRWCAPSSDMKRQTSGHRPRKRFGQHFLVDDQVITRIIDAIAPDQNDHLVEIGPGTGAMTRPLLARVKTLDVIELDRDLAARLRTSFQPDRLHVHETDVLRFSFRSLIKDNEKLHLLGNLPYNISTPLIFHLLEEASVISDMTFMLQKEVADRITASPGSRPYGRLSVMLQYRCHSEVLFDVAADAFDPPPKVMSTVIRLIPRTSPLPLIDERLFAKLIKQAFSQRRKTLHNVLKGVAEDADLEFVGLSPQARSETISLQQFVLLANHLSGE